ncbi:tyrosine-type recombinase/integrase [Streptomyces sp. XY332]|uniref:tyrosine-type recombinase/integrase n=1 Tax=Streptomyces sp. XY332 TaxID=1415561 RepID=UPI00099B34B8|nr:tyrosine-type recombinase/integrase [Streptomyces sp. XY332]
MRGVGGAGPGRCTGETTGDGARRRPRDQTHLACCAPSDPSDPFTGLVFCRPDGRPLRPHTVLDRLRQLSKEAGVPRVTVHDLRHLAATITITAGAPLTVVSKTLRHSTLSTTANVYSHLTQQAAREAVDTIDHTLTRAQKQNDRRAWLERLRPPRDHVQHLREVLNRLRSPRPDWLPPHRQPTPKRACDHTATTSIPGMEKAVLPCVRERPSSHV